MFAVKRSIHHGPPPGTGDRRSAVRYPMRLKVHFYLLGHRDPAPVAGQGRTINISSHGMLVSTTAAVEVGRLVELHVAWPCPAGASPRHELVVDGVVQRIEPERAAFSINRYAFLPCRP